MINNKKLVIIGAISALIGIVGLGGLLTSQKAKRETLAKKEYRARYQEAQKMLLSNKYSVLDLDKDLWIDALKETNRNEIAYVTPGYAGALSNEILTGYTQWMTPEMRSAFSGKYQEAMRIMRSIPKELLDKIEESKAKIKMENNQKNDR